MNCTVVMICFGLGGGLYGRARRDRASALATLGSGGGRAGRPLGRRRRARRAARARRICGTEAPFAVAFKNVALAAAVGGSLLGAVAALPGLLGFPVEILYFLCLARRRARRGVP